MKPKLLAWVVWAALAAMLALASVATAQTSLIPGYTSGTTEEAPPEGDLAGQSDQPPRPEQASSSLTAPARLYRRRQARIRPRNRRPTQWAKGRN